MNDKQKKFLALRASSLSFDKIASELKVSKPTLIQWGRIYKDEIDDLKFQSLAVLKEEYQFSVKAKYEQLLKHLLKIDKAISDIDLKATSIKDLMAVRNDLAEQLENIEKQTEFTQTGIVVTCEFTGEQEAVKIKLNELA